MIWIAWLLLAALLHAQEGAADVPEQSDKEYTFLLTGASFAVPSNGWFEVGCELVGAKPINRAIGGEAIAHTANRMIEGTLLQRGVGGDGCPGDHAGA
jgi:hypothetical protein